MKHFYIKMKKIRIKIEKFEEEDVRKQKISA